jgi:hypothetical protein
MKKIIRLTESDLTRIISRVIKEQIAVEPMFNLTKSEPFNLTKNIEAFAGKTPRVEDGPDTDECMKSFEQAVKDFFIEAKRWNYNADEKYMDSLIKKMYENTGGFSQTRQFLDAFSKIKTQAGMGYLARNFKHDGKNFFQYLESDHRFPWIMVAKILKDNGFYVSLQNPGCNNML